MASPSAPRRTTFRLQYVTCRRAGCRICQGERPAHGPYWFELVRGGKRVLGTRRPAEVSAAMEAAARKRAEAERARKDRIRERAKANEARGRARRLPEREAPAARADDLGRLGLAPGATPSQAKRAFRDLALKHHPDRAGGSKEEMQQLNDAYARVLRAFADAG